MKLRYILLMFLFTGILIYAPGILKNKTFLPSEISGMMKMQGGISPDTLQKIQNQQAERIRTHHNMMNYMPGEKNNIETDMTKYMQGITDFKDIPFSELIDQYTEAVTERDEFMTYLSNVGGFSNKSSAGDKQTSTIPSLKSGIDMMRGDVRSSRRIHNSRRYKTAYDLKSVVFSILQKISGNYLVYCIHASMVIIILSLIFRRTGISVIVSILGKTGLCLSRLVLAGISVSAVLFWFYSKHNLWYEGGVDVFLGPVLILSGSCIAMKIYDPNFPLFNKMLGSMSFPLLSSLLITASMLLKS